MMLPPVPRVAIVTHVAALSGAELGILRLVKHLDRERYVPVVVTFSDGPLVRRLRADGIETVVVPLAAGVAAARRADLLSWSAVRDAGALATFVPRLAKALRGLDIDIVHANSLKADLISVATVPLTRLPLVWNLHDRISDDYLPARTAQLVRWLARRVPRHVVVNSLATLQTLAPLPRGWTLAYPGLDVAEFAAGRNQGVNGEPVIGILGRIGPTKGQDLFLKAAAAVRETHPQVRFRVIGTALFGEQEYERALRGLSIELGLQDRVEFAGFATDPGAALRQLTACVHASPVPEPFGQVIVEAMAARVPTVVTDAGGASEIVHDGDRVLARLAAPGSVNDLADGMRWILDHPDQADDMSTQASLSVRRRFGIEQTATAIMQAWDTVLG